VQLNKLIESKQTNLEFVTPIHGNITIIEVCSSRIPIRILENTQNMKASDIVRDTRVAYAGIRED
jgi:hypothetical protein